MMAREQTVDHAQDHPNENAAPVPTTDSSGERPGSAAPPAKAVRIAPNLLHRLTMPDQARDERRDLDAVVHRVLLVGLGCSTVLMFTGVVLGLLRGRSMPVAMIRPELIMSYMAGMRPSGFLTLGLLVLIATPILRVIGSIAAFLYERDWRFAGITALVLMVMAGSMLLGRG